MNLTPERFRDYLRSRINGMTQAAFAKQLGISPQYLGDVLNGRREPGGTILHAIGFERVVRYRSVA